MILPAILSTVQAKLFLGLTAIFGVILAAGEVSSDKTLIIISIVGSGTTLVVAILSASVSIHNSRKLTKVAPAIQELRIEFDGHMKELIKAKEEIAHSAGADQERTAARTKLGEEAIAKQTAAPTEVLQVNPPEKPAHVKTV